MKTILLVAAVLMTQLTFSQHVHFGVKGGVNLANLKSSRDIYKAKTSFHAGLLAHIHLARQWAFQPELLYSSQGAEGKNTILNSEAHLHYINVPMPVQFMFNNGLRLETGPQPGFLISAKSKIGNTSTDIKDNLNTFDLSWLFGVGYIFMNKFGLDARYNLGITDVNEDNTSPDIKNSVFQIGVFYQFGGR